MNRFISIGEVRLGLRLIVKQPILSVTVVLALATGICLSTMGFTLRDEIVNAKLPYAGGERFGRLEAQEKIAAASTSIRSATTRSEIAPRRSSTLAHSARGRSH